MLGTGSSYARIIFKANTKEFLWDSFCLRLQSSLLAMNPLLNEVKYDKYIDDYITEFLDEQLSYF